MLLEIVFPSSRNNILVGKDKNRSWDFSEFEEHFCSTSVPRSSKGRKIQAENFLEPLLLETLRKRRPEEGLCSINFFLISLS